MWANNDPFVEVSLGVVFCPWEQKAPYRIKSYLNSAFTSLHSSLLELSVPKADRQLWKDMLQVTQEGIGTQEAYDPC